MLTLSTMSFRGTPSTDECLRHSLPSVPVDNPGIRCHVSCVASLDDCNCATRNVTLHLARGLRDLRLSCLAMLRMPEFMSAMHQHAGVNLRDLQHVKPGESSNHYSVLVLQSQPFCTVKCPHISYILQSCMLPTGASHTTNGMVLSHCELCLNQ